MAPHRTPQTKHSSPQTRSTHQKSVPIVKSIQEIPPFPKLHPITVRGAKTSSTPRQHPFQVEDLNFSNFPTTSTTLAPSTSPMNTSTSAPVPKKPLPKQNVPLPPSVQVLSTREEEALVPPPPPNAPVAMMKKIKAQSTVEATPSQKGPVDSSLSARTPRSTKTNIQPRDFLQGMPTSKNEALDSLSVDQTLSSKKKASLSLPKVIPKHQSKAASLTPKSPNPQKKMVNSSSVTVGPILGDKSIKQTPVTPVPQKSIEKPPLVPATPPQDSSTSNKHATPQQIPSLTGVNSRIFSPTPRDETVTLTMLQGLLMDLLEGQHRVERKTEEVLESQQRLERMTNSNSNDIKRLQQQLTRSTDNRPDCLPFRTVEDFRAF
ncbi:mucin-5AC-like [Diachasma alloeum]|uniref:mucin-5AC-like n=1 Tax=Diachasma alloeum TaxID=454923 RepID=UPI0007384AC9|nr:mucin-5AC-like [Diachasma alloeum]